jgi:hypothetical protein
MGIVRTSDAGGIIDGGARRVFSAGEGMADESFDILKGDDGCEVDIWPS